MVLHDEVLRGDDAYLAHESRSIRRERTNSEISKDVAMVWRGQLCVLQRIGRQEIARCIRYVQPPAGPDKPDGLCDAVLSGETTVPDRTWLNRRPPARRSGLSLTFGDKWDDRPDQEQTNRGC